MISIASAMKQEEIITLLEAYQGENETFTFKEKNGPPEVHECHFRKSILGLGGPGLHPCREPDVPVFEFHHCLLLSMHINIAESYCRHYIS